MIDTQRQTSVYLLSVDFCFFHRDFKKYINSIQLLSKSWLFSDCKICILTIKENLKCIVSKLHRSCLICDCTVAVQHHNPYKYYINAWISKYQFNNVSIIMSTFLCLIVFKRLFTHWNFCTLKCFNINIKRIKIKNKANVLNF